MVDLQVRRQLKLISHPARYCSRASDAFRRDVLPLFASADSPLRQRAPQLQGHSQVEGSSAEEAANAAQN